MTTSLCPYSYPRIPSCCALDYLFQISRVIPDWWLSYWVSNLKELSEWQFYITVFGILVAGSGALLCLRDSVLAFAELKASSALHNRMLDSLFRAPVSFFDSTPQGRIINRFSADQDTLDVALPRNLNSLYSCLCVVLSTVITIVAITWPFVLVLIPVTYVFHKVQLLLPLKQLHCNCVTPMFS
jgi:ABC-type multidrug transport system fused ATPase/permease subunit